MRDALLIDPRSALHEQVNASRDPAVADEHAMSSTHKANAEAAFCVNCLAIDELTLVAADCVDRTFP